VGSGVAFERVEDVYRMDPARIVLDGPYVRQFVEDADFRRLVAAVGLERDIGQHVGVRVVGPPTEARRVLVYGMRRWKAALQVGLDRVPVRDYGRISEEKAVELQMLENEIRADPHPVDTALGFYLLSQQAAWSQKRIAEVFDKNKGYVSEMVRAGEAVARLRESDRLPLYTAPRVTVRAFQNLAVVKSVEARREALLALVDPAPDGAAGPEGDARAPAAPGSAPDGPGADGRDRPARPPPAPRRRERLLGARHPQRTRVPRPLDRRRPAPRRPRIADEFRAGSSRSTSCLLHRAAVLGAGAGPGGRRPGRHRRPRGQRRPGRRPRRRAIGAGSAPPPPAPPPPAPDLRDRGAPRRRGRAAAVSPGRPRAPRRARPPAADAARPGAPPRAPPPAGAPPDDARPPAGARRPPTPAGAAPKRAPRSRAPRRPAVRIEDPLALFVPERFSSARSRSRSTCSSSSRAR
jgi:translation initiation factor IF-2